MRHTFPLNHTRADFGHSPMVVFYETTRACDLRCAHCRADAQQWCDPRELTTAHAKQLVDQLAMFPMPPLLVLTGGDPMKRHDVFEIIGHAVAAGLTVAMTPSATPLVTSEAVRCMKQAGLHRLAVSLDGADAVTHDGFRRVRGSFERTFQIMADARACGLPLQVNTTIARHNVGQVDAIADRLAGEQIELWSVFFLVPTGRATAGQRITPDGYEIIFEKLLGHARRQPYAIKTTEAPHYRRFLMQRLGQAPAPRRAPPTSRFVGTNDGKGVMFIVHRGEIYPSGFLPILCGRFPQDSVGRVYEDSPLFRDLRDGDRLAGKCGACEFRHVCGGSRARSFALTGDPLAAEPDCLYRPPKWEDSKYQEPSHAEHHQPLM